LADIIAPSQRKMHVMYSIGAFLVRILCSLPQICRFAQAQGEVSADMLLSGTRCQRNIRYSLRKYRCYKEALQQFNTQHGTFLAERFLLGNAGKRGIFCASHQKSLDIENQVDKIELLRRTMASNPIAYLPSFANY